MKRLILPIILLGLTLTAMADADLTSARIYRNQGELVKADHFFSLAIEKSPDLYVAYFERGEMYGMIATDRTKKGVMRDIVGEIDDPQYAMLEKMLADFNVIRNIEDEKVRGKQKNLKKIENIIESYWTDFYNESVDADVKHVEKLAVIDSLKDAGDTLRAPEGSEEPTTFDKAIADAKRLQESVIHSCDICILLKPDEWNPFALKAQVLDRVGKTGQANVIWEKALMALDASDLKEKEKPKYTEAWRIIQLHRLQNYYNADNYEKTIEVSNEIIAVCLEEGFSSSALESMSEEDAGEAQHCKDAYVFKAFAIISEVHAADSTADMSALRNTAIGALKDAHAASPDDSAIPFYLGQFYLEEGDTTKTLEWWKLYTQLDPEDYEVLFQIGYIYLEGGTYIDYAKSETIYQELVDRHPDQCTGWINLGVSQIKQDKTKIGAENVKKGEECSKQ